MPLLEEQKKKKRNWEDQIRWREIAKQPHAVVGNEVNEWTLIGRKSEGSRVDEMAEYPEWPD